MHARKHDGNFQTKALKAQSVVTFVVFLVFLHGWLKGYTQQCSLLGLYSFPFSLPSLLFTNTMVSSIGIVEWNPQVPFCRCSTAKLLGNSRPQCGLFTLILIYVLYNLRIYDNCISHVTLLHVSSFSGVFNGSFPIL